MGCERRLLYSLRVIHDMFPSAIWPTTDKLWASVGASHGGEPSGSDYLRVGEFGAPRLFPSFSTRKYQISYSDSRLGVAPMRNRTAAENCELVLTRAMLLHPKIGYSLRTTNQKRSYRPSPKCVKTAIDDLLDKYHRHRQVVDTPPTVEVCTMYVRYPEAALLELKLLQLPSCSRRATAG